MIDRTFERAVLDWLEDGSDRTPARAIDAVLLAIRTTPRGRGLAAPRRFSPMPWTLRFTGAAILAGILIGGALYVIGPSLDVGGPTPTPSTTAVPTQGPGTAAGRIAFVRESASTNTDIWTMNVDGTDLRQLTSLPSPEEGPAWSPDGSRIAFVIGDTAAQIWVMAADGSDQHALTHTDFPVGRQVSWSPDGTRIVFADAEHGGLYVINADGTGITQVTGPAPAGSEPWTTGDRAPTWSPKGDLIAFVNGGSVFTIRPDGTNRSIYIPGSRPDRPVDAQPEWSSNAARHAVTINQEIWLIDDTESYSLTTRTRVGVSGAASWSPDGQWLLFAGVPASASRGDFDLFVINIDGSGFRNILPGDGSAYAPVWAPR